MSTGSPHEDPTQDDSDVCIVENEDGSWTAIESGRVDALIASAETAREARRILAEKIQTRDQIASTVLGESEESLDKNSAQPKVTFIKAEEPFGVTMDPTSELTDGVAEKSKIAEWIQEVVVGESETSVGETAEDAAIDLLFGSRYTSQFPTDPTERAAAVIRINACLTEAADLFEGDKNAAAMWMITPQVTMQNKVPFAEACASEDGSHGVMQLIGRIKYSVFG